MKRIIFLILAGILAQISFAGEKTDSTDVKTGWNFGVMPVVSYNSDLGFQYGGLTNFYFYGDGDAYPNYYHSIYAEVSRYTKGTGIYRLFYDSEYLIPGVRLTADLLYMPELAVDFYGFNGYNAQYDHALTDASDPYYISRMFYKHERNILRFKADFRGNTGIKNLSWVLGYNFMKIDIAPVDIAHLNDGKEGDDLLPDTESLYEKYINWGIIEEDEADGGMHHSVKTGLVYDTRDNEACPMSGLWSEVVLLNSFGKDYPYFGKLAITHRQYFTIIPKDLSFAYRLGYQGIVLGEAPFYMYPYMVYSYMPSSTVDGLGGAKSVRGLIRNRVVAKSMGFANIEFRYKFLRFQFINQNWYLAFNPFMDIGRSIDQVAIDKSPISTSDAEMHFAENEESLHFSFGGGLHLAMNENFVIAAECGYPLRKQDGGLGIYIGMNWLF